MHRQFLAHHPTHHHRSRPEVATLTHATKTPKHALPLSTTFNSREGRQGRAASASSAGDARPEVDCHTFPLLHEKETGTTFKSTSGTRADLTPAVQENALATRLGRNNTFDKKECPHTPRSRKGYNKRAFHTQIYIYLPCRLLQGPFALHPRENHSSSCDETDAARSLPQLEARCSLQNCGRRAPCPMIALAHHV